MASHTAIHPDYADRFRCIGSECEDTCCGGWTVPVDEATWNKYQSLPHGPLPDLIRDSVVRNEPASGRPANAPFTILRMNQEHRCPLLTEDRMCRVHGELGQELLPQVCASYPRVSHSLGEFTETALCLSCPEAARGVVQSTELLTTLRAAKNNTTHGNFQALHDDQEVADLNGHSAEDASQSFPYQAIRQAIFRTLRDRSYPLWQRLFLLGLLCRRLDRLQTDSAVHDSATRIRRFITDFAKTERTGSLRSAMERLPIDRDAHLDIVLRLAGLMLHKSNVPPRFAEAIQAFTSGIGNKPGATLASLAAHYSFAHQRFYAPFMQRSPHVMENILINTIVRSRFPFGKPHLPNQTRTNMTREFVMLMAQFALTRGLLIGVAGHHGDLFSSAHIVHALQSAARHFEHHPEFLPMAYTLLVEAKLDGARGLAVVLRDPEPTREELRLPELRVPMCPGEAGAIPA